MSISFVPFQQCIRICAVKIYPHSGQEMFWQRLRQPYGGGGSILLGEWFDWKAFHQTFPSNGPPVSLFWVSGEGYSPGGSESVVGSKLLRRKMIDSLTGRKKDFFFFNSTEEILSPSTSFVNLQSNFPASPALLHLTSRGLGAWKWMGPLLRRGDTRSSKRSSLFLGNQKQRALSIRTLLTPPDFFFFRLKKTLFFIGP